MKNFLEKFNLLSIEGYKYDSELTGGKMASTIVYRKETGEKAVVKFLIYPRNENELKRFLDEANLLKKLKDFNNSTYVLKPLTEVKKVEDFEIYYFLMEFVEGETLENFIKANPLPWSTHESTKMLYRIAVALSYSLQAGIIHRDIHVKNIIIAKHDYNLGDEDTHIRLIDYGVSKDWWMKYFQSEKKEDNFRHIGAMSSWSPELLKSPAEVDNKHDIWALGTLYFKFLTDKWAYEADNFGDYYDLIINGSYNEKYLNSMNNDQFPKILLKRLFDIDKRSRVSTGGITKMCHDYLRGDFKRIEENNELLALYLSSDGDVWKCPMCNSIVIPNANRCSKCGNFIDDFLSI